MESKVVQADLTGGGGGGTGNILSINSDTTAAQVITSDGAGTDVGVVTSGGTTTISVPNASATARGVVSTGAQTFAGAKTFSSAPIISALTASTVPYLGAGKALTSSAVTPTELGYVSGVTSAIQTQFTAKAPLDSPAFTTQATFSYGTVSTVPYFDASRKLISSAVTPTELGYVSGVTSAIQTQIGTKAPSTAPTFATSATFSYATVSTVPYWDASKNLISSAVTPTELGYVSGVTSALQTQIAAKAPTASPAFTTQVTFGNYHLEPSEVDDGNSSTADTIDWSTGAVHKSTLTGSCTYTFSNPVTGGTYLLRVLTGSGSFTVTWPGTVKWPAGTAPTITATASRMDLISFVWDGTNYYGSFLQNYTP